MLNTFFYLALFVLAIQVVLFFVIKARKKKMKSESIIDRFDINSRADAWKILNQPDLAEQDRIKINKLYKEMR